MNCAEVMWMGVFSVDVTLVVIPEPPAETTVIERTGFPPGPAFVGDGAGEVNLLCGGCGFAVAERLETVAQVQALVIKCPRCSAYNESRM